MPIHDAMVKFNIKEEVVCISCLIFLYLYGTADAVSDGPPYNIALLDGQVGTICCNSSTSLHWRSLSPSVEGLANGESHARPGYNDSENPSGNYCLQFAANSSSTPTKISCSEPISGIERSVHVIVFKSPFCDKTINADVTRIICSADFRGDIQWRPSFECILINGSQRNVVMNGSTSFSHEAGLHRVITKFSIRANSKKTNHMCSLKFNKDGDVTKGTAANTPELHWTSSERELEESKKNDTGEIPPWGIALIVLSVVGAVVFAVVLCKKVCDARNHDMTITRLLLRLTVRQSLQKEIVFFHCYEPKTIAFYTIILWLVPFSLFSGASSTLVEVPQNAFVLGCKSLKTIDMACKSDSQSSLIWFAQKNDDSEKEQLYNGYFLRPDAKSYCTVITDEPGKYHLRFGNTAEAAQTYICLEPDTLAEVSADFIWLSDLICNDSSTGNLLNLTCSVEFRGNWAPSMEWKEHSSNGEKVLSVGVNTVTVPNQRLTSTLVMAVQVGSRNYTCTTKFDISGKPNHTTATNVPDCNLKWTSSVFTKFQDEPSPSLGAATATIGAIAAGVIVIAAILIMPAVLLICKKHMRDQNQKEKQRNEEKPRNLLIADAYRSSEMHSSQSA